MTIELRKTKLTNNIRTLTEGTCQVVCQEKEGDDVYTQFIAGIIEILYATEEGFGPAEDDVEGELEPEDDEQEEY